MVRKEALMFVLFTYLFISIAFLAISTNANNIFVKVPRPTLTKNLAVQYGESRDNNNNIDVHCECCVWRTACLRFCCKSKTKIADEMPPLNYAMQYLNSTH
ncbi:uncharacterized protein DS421_18g615140 [Arachis hypogaea]|nr:uncharacterized protein LOC114925751 [Arachis hypogaea]QHN96064.1 uncharacterized protein DS421_18g615140 [Arachis hypogaea]